MTEFLFLATSARVALSGHLVGEKHPVKPGEIGETGEAKWTDWNSLFSCTKEAGDFDKFKRTFITSQCG